MKFLLFVIRVYYEKIGHILKPLVPNFRPDLSARLTRASVAVSATFAMVCVCGGGGSKWPHLLTLKLRGTERRVKKRSIALSEYFRKYSVIFFAQVNIEVTKREIWRSVILFFSEMCHYLKIYYRYQATKKALDSPFEALSLT